MDDSMALWGALTCGGLAAAALVALCGYLHHRVKRVEAAAAQLAHQLAELAQATSRVDDGVLVLGGVLLQGGVLTPRELARAREALLSGPRRRAQETQALLAGLPNPGSLLERMVDPGSRRKH